MTYQTHTPRIVKCSLVRHFILGRKRRNKVVSENALLTT